MPTYPQDIHKEFTMVRAQRVTIELRTDRGGTLAEPKLAEWRRVYREALTETDPEALTIRICAAESVLFSPLQQMHREPTNRDEAIAIYDAIHSLRVLRCRLYARKKRDELSLMWRRSA